MLARLRHVAEVDPVKSEVRLVPEDAEVSFLPMADVGYGGELVSKETRLLGEVYDGYTYVSEGDVAIATISPSFQNGKGGLLAKAVNGICFATTELTVVRPGPEIHPRYLLYVLQSHDFVEQGVGRLYGVAGQQRVPTDYIRDFKFWLPSWEEQERLLAVLDRELGQIDAVLKMNERLLELLGERFAAFRTRRLCGAHSNDRPTRATEIAWAPSCPTDSRWRVTRLKNACRLQRGYDLPTQSREGGDVPVVSSGGVIDYHSSSKAPGPGVVTGRYGTIGQVFFVDGPFWPLNTALYVSDFLGQDERYVFHLLSAVPLDAESNKSAVGGINRNVVHDLPIVLAPLVEQRAIADSIDEEARRLDRMRGLLQEQQALIRERRRAFITEAVTDRFDPRVA